MSLSFKNKISIEQIRALEENGQPLLARFDGATATDFTAWLDQRRQALQSQAPVKEALLQAPTLYRKVLVSMSTLMVLVGIISSSNLLSQSTATLNIFWLLGALLGINALSLLLWSLFVATARNSNAGVVATLLHQVMTWLTPSADAKKRNPNRAASRAWYLGQLNVQFHHWYLGRLTHWAWCCFLCGSMLGLLLLFSTRQFDFVWESTLLSADSFIQLSQTLAAPLQWFGFSTPSTTDILSSGAGDTQFSGALRQQWALFILACLALYGLLPRIIAAGLCLALEYRGKRIWQLDFSLPYYRKLQQQYWPSSSAARILDADPAPASNITHATTVEVRAVPTNAFYVGIELPPKLAWPGLHSDGFLGQITDRASKVRLSESMSATTDPIVIVVDSNKAPDRGLRRNLEELYNQCQQPWLGLLDNGQASESKWRAWQALALELGILDTQITRIPLTS